MFGVKGAGFRGARLQIQDSGFRGLRVAGFKVLQLRIEISGNQDFRVETPAFGDRR